MNSKQQSELTSTTRRRNHNSIKKGTKFLLNKETDLDKLQDLRITKAKHLVEHCYKIRDKSE